MLAKDRLTGLPLQSAALTGADTSHTLCLVHPIDPRGNKVGGIETHVRMMMRLAPRDWRVLLVGVDAVGDCRLGAMRKLTVEGRSVDFLPVLPRIRRRPRGRSLRR